MLVFRYTWVTGREPLTYYDMNLSAQDHQTFFTCDSDHLRPADASKPTHTKYIHLDLCGQVVMWPIWHLKYVSLCVCVLQLCRRHGERGTHRLASPQHMKLLSSKSEFASSFLFLSLSPSSVSSITAYCSTSLSSETSSWLSFKIVKVLI